MLYAHLLDFPPQLGELYLLLGRTASAIGELEALSVIEGDGAGRPAGGGGGTAGDELRLHVSNAQVRRGAAPSVRLSVRPCVHPFVARRRRVEWRRDGDMNEYIDDDDAQRADEMSLAATHAGAKKTRRASLAPRRPAPLAAPPPHRSDNDATTTTTTTTTTRARARALGCRRSLGCRQRALHSEMGRSLGHALLEPIGGELDALNDLPHTIETCEGAPLGIAVMAVARRGDAAHSSM